MDVPPSAGYYARKNTDYGFELYRFDTFDERRVWLLADGGDGSREGCRPELEPDNYMRVCPTCGQPALASDLED